MFAGGRAAMISISSFQITTKEHPFVTFFIHNMERYYVFFCTGILLYVRFDECYQWSRFFYPLVSHNVLVLPTAMVLNNEIPAVVMGVL
jgi:hypothetical protein